MREAEILERKGETKKEGEILERGRSPLSNLNSPFPLPRGRGTQGDGVERFKLPHLLGLLRLAII